MVAEAARLGRILAVDHTFLYTSSVQKIKDLITDGTIGDLIYVDSVRINLGLFQSDVNVVFDLAPHDISITTYLSDQDPEYVQATGMCYGTENTESVAYSHFEYASGMVSHSHLSWLSPVKIRKTLVAGTQKMVVYDDMEPSDKIKVFDKGIVKNDVDIEFESKLDRETNRSVKIDYRTGDMLAPKLEEAEALDTEAKHFIDCVRTRKTPISDGNFGLRVLRQIEACNLSIKQNGKRIRLDEIK
jgi:predicted dehydrogenase